MITFRNFGDCSSSVLGSGNGKCDITSFGDARGMALMQKNTFLSVANDSFDLATYKGLVKALQVFPFLELFNFEQPTPENEKNTSSTGVKTEVRPGKPEFNFSFDKGGCFHKALYDKRGKGRWDLAIIFDEGVLMASNQGASKVLGFDMGMLSVETFKLVQGTDPQMSTAMIQLLDSYQFNALHEFFTWEQLGFNMNQIDGAIETSISYATAPTTSTNVSVKVSGGCNSDEVISGLDDAAKWRIGGSQASATTISAVAFNASAGTYDFTLDTALATGDTVQFELFDGANGYRVVEDALDALYKGAAPLATV